GILGSSLGSCIALLAAAHEPRIRAAVFNHISMNFGDVVWDGVSCRHIQATIHQCLTQDQLNACWKAISPAAYLDRLQGRQLESLLVWATHDTTFRPRYSQRVIE